jgi:DNA-binding NarL/FixJ family response regulator
MEFSIDKIIIADDHPMFRSALKQSILSDHNNCEIIECESLESLRIQAKSNPDSDLLILDLNMPGADGFSSLIYIQNHYPNLPVIMISANEKLEIIHQAKTFGALGYISKSATIETIRQAINTVLDGDTYFPEELNTLKSSIANELLDITKSVSELTPQQYNVLQMIKQGLLNKQIAYDLNITEATVKAHVTAIMRKLGVNNRTQAVMKASIIDLNE